MLFGHICYLVVGWWLWHVGCISQDTFYFIVLLARFGDLALMPNEQPRSGEELLLLLVIYVRVDEDFAADGTRVKVHHAGGVTIYALWFTGSCHIGFLLNQTEAIWSAWNGLPN